jgi:hypothetical protein
MPTTDRVNVDEQTENLKSAPISICSLCSSCIGASYLPSTTDYEIADSGEAAEEVFATQDVSDLQNRVFSLHHCAARPGKCW